MAEMKDAPRAVIASADVEATMQRMRESGNPATRKSASLMSEIAGMHQRNDYNRARECQIANDVLFYLPMDEIGKLVAEYRTQRGENLR